MNKAGAAVELFEGVCNTHGVYREPRIVGLPWKPACPLCSAPPVTDASFNAILADAQRKEVDFRRLGIPYRFAVCTFANYAVSPESAKDQAKAKLAAQAYAHKFDTLLQFGTSMVFSGRVGTGKTHLACAIVRELAARAITARYVTLLTLMERIKSTFGTTAEDAAAAFKEFVSPVLLVIDEIGIQYGSDAEGIILYRILNARYENLRPTILVTNLDDNGLANCIGAPLVDRLKENGGQFIAFNWDSHRGTKPAALIDALKKASPEPTDRDTRKE